MNDSGTSLRRRLMDARGSLDADTQGAAAKAIVQRITDVILTRRVTTVGAYLAERGEVDLGPTLIALIARGISIAVPVCGPGVSLEFCPWSPGDSLSTGAFGIAEPTSEPLPLSTIDAFLVPGVGFDVAGSRVGHGAGYYDRYFARCFDADHDPLRLGIAHDFQVIDLPVSQSWDVSMHGIVTPTRTIMIAEKAT